MFEVGFTEMLLIFALALVVLGPERLPRVAAQVGRWIGRAKSMARQFRDQLDEEVRLDEPEPPRAPRRKYYQPDDDIARNDVSHADAGSADDGGAPGAPSAPPPAQPDAGTAPATDAESGRAHERGA